MDERRTGEETRARNTEAMGHELGELYTLLDTELVWVFILWRQFVQLYAEEPSRIDLLNESASFFFGLLQQNLWEDTLLGITRLTGPERSSGNQNLSLRRLPPLIPNRRLRSRVEHLVDEVKEKAGFAQDWRNRHIAHRDLDLLTKPEAEPLKPASKEAVDAVLDACAAVLNAMAHFYFDSSTAYRATVTLFDAGSLLLVLRDGVRLGRRRDELLGKGIYDPEDWIHDESPI